MAEVELHHDLSFIGEKQFQIRRVKMRNLASYIRYNQKLRFPQLFSFGACCALRRGEHYGRQRAKSGSTSFTI